MNAAFLLKKGNVYASGKQYSEEDKEMTLVRTLELVRGTRPWGMPETETLAGQSVSPAGREHRGPPNKPGMYASAQR